MGTNTLSVTALAEPLGPRRRRDIPEEIALQEGLQIFLASLTTAEQPEQLATPFQADESPDG